jgi:hypothetical protein
MHFSEKGSNVVTFTVESEGGRRFEVVLSAAEAQRFSEELRGQAGIAAKVSN